MIGWLNVYKEKGITSHDVVYKVRKALGFKKIGHAGTLDPMATGVMVVAVGKATRLIQFLQETKRYRAKILLGVTTSTLDAEGVILKTSEVNVEKSQVESVIKNFVGKIKQVPPMVSALHHNGVRLYDLARKGIEVERKSRDIEIYSIDILNLDIPIIEIDVKCQSGTYIRVLADDIGKELGCGAHLIELERTESNECFNSSNLIEISQIKKENLLNLDYPLNHLEKILLNDEDSVKYLQGQAIYQINSYNNFIKVFDENNSFLGIGKSSDNKIQPYVNINID